jgi:excisionase family DNA binding protein
MRRKVSIPALLSVEELAVYLGLKKQTIYNWLNQGRIAGIKIGKVWRFEKSDIEKWLRECKKQK